MCASRSSVSIACLCKLGVPIGIIFAHQDGRNLSFDLRIFGPKVLKFWNGHSKPALMAHRRGRLSHDRYQMSPK